MDQDSSKRCRYLYSSATEVSVDQLLSSKEARRERQKELLNQYHTTVVCLTLIAPGSVKSHQGLRFIFYKALGALFNLCDGHDWKVVHATRLLKNTGFEAYWVISTEAEEVKKALICLEERLPYGRLCDFDVIQYNEQCRPSDGFDGNIISRSDLGKVGRKCLVCDDQAHVCTRSRKHPMTEVLVTIEGIIVESIGC